MLASSSQRCAERYDKAQGSHAASVLHNCYSDRFYLRGHHDEEHIESIW